MKIEKAHYLASFPHYDKCPKDKKPCYAFIGRSNVGKSSLINTLTQRKNLAHVSKSPGKTQMINYYLVNDDWYLIDLPGYGYAQRSKKMRKEWRDMIERYLVINPDLMTTFVLIDLRHDLQTIDREFIDWLGSRHLPFNIIFTKADKVKPALHEKHRVAIEKALLETWEFLPDRFLSSSANGLGREEILSFIEKYNAVYYKKLAENSEDKGQ